MPEIIVNEDQRNALFALADVLTAVESATSEALYIQGQLPSPEETQFDPEECARALQRINSHVKAAQNAHGRIKRLYGGPQGTTGASSPVETAVEQAATWVDRIVAIKDRYKALVLDAIAQSLSLDEVK